jgi:hypothetical protein
MDLCVRDVQSNAPIRNSALKIDATAKSAVRWAVAIAMDTVLRAQNATSQKNQNI